jgi:gluconolactonase
LQDALTYEAEKIAAGLQFVDGMVWSHAGFLAVADVRQRKLFHVDPVPNATPKPLLNDDGGASGLAYDLQSRLYICESVTRRVSRMDLKGKVDPVAENFEGKKFNAPNDIVVRRDGHVYFTDPAFGSAADRRELDFNGVFHLTPKGDLEAVAKWQTRPNGIALSLDGRVLFVSDSDRHAIVAFDLDKNGAAGNPRDVVKNVKGVPGGIKTDVEGRFYIAALGVPIYSSQGKLERTLLETTNTSNCAFGENDLESLFIGARDSVFKVKLGVKGALQY